MTTLQRVVDTGVEGIKLHPLHIVDGSIMAKAWRAGRLSELPLDTYVATAGEMIRHTPPEVVFHRISASARRPTADAAGTVMVRKPLDRDGGTGFIPSGSLGARLCARPTISTGYLRGCRHELKTIIYCSFFRQKQMGKGSLTL